MLLTAVLAILVCPDKLNRLNYVLQLFCSTIQLCCSTIQLFCSTIQLCCSTIQLCCSTIQLCCSLHFDGWCRVMTGCRVMNGHGHIWRPSIRVSVYRVLYNQGHGPYFEPKSLYFDPTRLHDVGEGYWPKEC